MLHLGYILLVSLSMFHPADSIVAPTEKPFGSVIRTVREVEMTGDTTAEILQIETTKSKLFNKILVRFGIYSKAGKPLYRDEWKASSYFDPIDQLPDTIKWRRLERILRNYFVNRNFLMDSDETLKAIFERAQPVDIKLESAEAKEFTATPHKIYSVFAGRDELYGLTWLDSKKRFVKVWKN
ncbi:MAG TPA: hypothetical protein VFO76_07555 [Candidatus Kapabacteria bacterium]|nr:hypothetical protein [Candidatus Kapabacteria bacterium]